MHARLKVQLTGYNPNTKIPFCRQECVRIAKQYLDKIGCPRYLPIELDGYIAQFLLEVQRTRTKAKPNNAGKEFVQKAVLFETLEKAILSFFRTKATHNHVSKDSLVS